VPEYKDIQKTLATQAGLLNGRFADFDWVPVNYLNRSFNRSELVEFYRGSRVGLITPLRDGMNLVAKEYVASQDGEDPGVLVLSRFAGAARELDAAIIVNPFDFDAVAAAIAQGLAMPLDERKERWNAMMRVLREYTLNRWRDEFLDALRHAPYE
jgi:trehalose 6-phosphate synthase